MSLKQELRQHLAPQLRRIRADKKLYLSKVAHDCKLSPHAIDTIELGNNASLKKYLQLASYYGKRVRVELVD